jgi:hypothetical protein
MLPKIEHPIHEVYLKSLDKKIRFRPFLVKEEKLLLMAKETDELNEVVKTIKQIITNCCLDDIDIDSLPTFDIEMFFIHLRMQSVGSLAEMTYQCNNIVNGNTCDHKINFNLALENVKYKIDDNHTNIIKLTDAVGVKFNYPTLNIPQSVLDEKFQDGGYEVIVDYLDYIYDANQIYKAKDVSKDELLAFFESLTLDQVRNIKNFFATSPRVILEQKITCEKCSYVHDVNVEGILNFFE